MISLPPVAPFGRGSLRFLYPGNRKVLAFLREMKEGDTDEAILCVSNLSRSAQAVELDLALFAGRVPIDMVGGSVFPPVGQLTYLLTLPPYGFFWFLLASEAQLPHWHAAAPEPLPDYATLVVRQDIAEVLEPANRKTLEGDALPAYLPKRRWFASKGETLRRARFTYATELQGGQDPVLFGEVEITVGDRQETYTLPLGIVWEDDISSALVQQLALARVRRGRRVGYLTDAFAVDGLTAAMMSGLQRAAGKGSRVKLDAGALLFRPTSRLADLHLPEDPDVHRLSAEQSNSSLIYGEAVMFKLIRRVSPGIHPEAEMTRFLTEHGFANTAALFGELLRIAPDGTPHTLALAQAFVRNQGDAWRWTLDFLNRTVEELAITNTEIEAGADAFATYTGFAAAIGRRLADMHAVLAAPSGDPDFRPEPATPEILRNWADSAIEQIGEAFRVLRAVREWPDEASGALANELLDHEAALTQAAAALAASSGEALRTRIHGDFHLGQVLVVQDDAFIIDFEGEPARPVAQRRAKSNPLRDVAGLLRSLDYAAASGGHAGVANTPLVAERRDALLARFRAEAGDAFLRAYRDVLRNAEHRWVADETEAPLLDLFLIEKAAYEICYEAANRPAWLAIPLRGLHQIAERVLMKETLPA